MAYKRINERAADEMRPVHLLTDYLQTAEGSVLIEVGSTRVLCAASIGSLALYGHNPLWFLISGGLIYFTWGEIYSLFPATCTDSYGSQYAATNAGMEGVARAITLLEAECDVIVVDTAHGHSQGVLDTVARIKRESNYAQVVAGYVATADGSRRK